MEEQSVVGFCMSSSMFIKCCDMSLKCGNSVLIPYFALFITVRSIHLLLIGSQIDMRNLVPLERQCWPLAVPQPSTSSQRAASFAVSNVQNQVFVLHADGQIDALDLATGAYESAMAMLESDSPETQWTWLQCVDELEAIVCASTSGQLVALDIATCAVEEIGAMDDGICGFAWSSNQEMLAVLTGAGALLIMNAQWEVITETNVDAFLPAELCMVTAKASICWREDAAYLAVNLSTAPRSKPAAAAAIRTAMVFTGQLEFHALGRLEDGRAIRQLGNDLDWAPNHSLLASSETRKDQLYVVFFERNGLRHGEFAIPAEYSASQFRVTRVGWNIDSDILAVMLEEEEPTTGQERRSVLQLWVRSNYHWYLKQERRFHLEQRLLIQFAWDEEVADRLQLLTRNSSNANAAELQLQQEEFAWTVARSERQAVSPGDEAVSKSIAVTGVIDARTLLLTPLHQALVPPPFALHQLAFDFPINSVVFDAQTEDLSALLSNSDVVLVQGYLQPAESQKRTTVYSREEGMLGSLLWMHSSGESVSLVAKRSWNDELVFMTSTADGAASATATVSSPALDGVRTASAVLGGTQRDALISSVAIQCHDGSLHVVAPLASNAVTKMPTSYPVFSELVAVNDASLVIGVQQTAKLFVNDTLVTPACSSFRYCESSSILLYTTLGSHSQLRMLPLNALRERKVDVFEARMIERGAKLVAVVGDRANVIVQMPRGNLECVAPRLLVLARTIQHLEQLEYVAALEMCRKHRLDLNLLVDYNPQAFLQHFQQHLLQTFIAQKPERITSDRLCLFATNLHPVDVWTTKYQAQVAPFSDLKEAASTTTDKSLSGKVNVVCQSMMMAIEERIEVSKPALLLPFLTCAVKQDPPQYTSALTRIQQLLQHKNDQSDLALAKRAIKHLILLTQVDLLYDEALGMYDLELVRFIATYSQRDPKEYMPFLETLAGIEDDNLRKYSIDQHLNRHERALVHLSALLSTSADDQERLKFEAEAIELIEQGSLYDQALRLFPASLKEFQARILGLKAKYLEKQKRFEDAAYVYISISAWSEACDAFMAARNWQMGLSLACKAKKTSQEVQALAYQVAEELLSHTNGLVEVFAVARIYVEYCNDIDEAVALLVANKQWDESLRIAYLHKREDLIESDIECGVLQLYEDLVDELKAKEASYAKNWKRLNVIREQKRLFKLHGIDGSRWQQDGDRDDADSVYSGAPSAADSALSNASMRSVGSHNSAVSIGNFAMQSLTQATSSHFYATQTLGGMDGASKKGKKTGGRRERRNRMKEGSAEEEQYVAQQVEENQPNAALKSEIKALLKMLVFFGKLKAAETLQSLLAAFEQRIKLDLAALATTSGDGVAEISEAVVDWKLQSLPCL